MRKAKILYTPDPVLSRLIQLAKKELKQMDEAKVDMNFPRRFTVQGIVNHSMGCCTIEGTKHHFLKYTGDVGITGQEAAYLNTIVGKY